MPNVPPAHSSHPRVLSIRSNSQKLPREVALESNRPDLNPNSDTSLLCVILGGVFKLTESLSQNQGMAVFLGHSIWGH